MLSCVFCSFYLLFCFVRWSKELGFVIWGFLGLFRATCRVLFSSQRVVGVWICFHISSRNHSLYSWSSFSSLLDACDLEYGIFVLQFGFVSVHRSLDRACGVCKFAYWFFTICAPFVYFIAILKGHMWSNKWKMLIWRW
jgi:hypothetical protein